MALTEPDVADAVVPVPRPGIMDIEAYVGGEAKAEGAARLIRLASNESALGPSPRAVAAYHAVANDIFRYPDGGSTALRQAIGAKFGLPAAQIVCGTGSDELLNLLTKAYAGPGDEVIHSAHGFLVFGMSAQIVGATPVSVPEPQRVTDVDAILAHVTPRTRLVFIANPNNPTGAMMTRAELHRLHAGLPGTVVLVVDGAYAEYVSDADYCDGAELVRRFPNVVMTRTFSKIFGLGGLRLGWAFCPPAIADALNRIRGPFNVNGAAQAAGIAALADSGFLETARRHNEICRASFSAALTALGLHVYPSAGNFVMASFSAGIPDSAGAPRAEAARLFLKSQGVLVRQLGAYGLSDCLRFTIGTDDEMAFVAAQLGAFLAS